VGLAGETAPWKDDATLPDIATYFAAALHDIKRDGPLHLMGHSFGGMLAYEVACQLRAAGAQVGLVLVADTGPEQLQANTPWTVLRNLPKLLEVAPRRIHDFVFQTPIRLKIGEIQRKLVAWRFLVKSKMGRTVAAQPLGGALDTRHLPGEMRKRMETNF